MIARGICVISGFPPSGTPRARNGGNAGACSVVETGEADKVVSDVSDTDPSQCMYNYTYIVRGLSPKGIVLYRRRSNASAVNFNH